MGDTWPDAKLADCFFYLWTCKRVAVPQEWKETMERFAKELKAVPLHLFGGRDLKGLPSIRAFPILSCCVALLPSIFPGDLRCTILTHLDWIPDILRLGLV